MEDPLSTDAEGEVGGGTVVLSAGYQARIVERGRSVTVQQQPMSVAEERRIREWREDAETCLLRQRWRRGDGEVKPCIARK